MSQLKVYCATYCALCRAVVRHYIIATAILFSWHNNSFLINNVPLFKRVAFNVALFDIAPFNLAVYDTSLFDVDQFNIVLFDAPPFSCCTI